MEPRTLEAITAAVAPIVMVSASGLLLMGIQAKNLHLADRIRALTAEYRALGEGPGHEARRRMVRDQILRFQRRIRLNQRSLELLYAAVVCFVVTSLLLAATPWLGATRILLVVTALFVTGVGVLLLALVVEFLEMRAGLATLGVEIEGSLRPSDRG